MVRPLTLLFLFAAPPLYAQSFNGFIVEAGLVHIIDHQDEPLVLIQGSSYLQTKKSKPARIKIASEQAMINASGMGLIAAKKGATFELRSYSTAGMVSNLDGATTKIRYISGESPIVKFGRKRVTIEYGEIQFTNQEQRFSTIYARERNSAATIHLGKRSQRLIGSDSKSNFIEGDSIKFRKARSKKAKKLSLPPAPKSPKPQKKRPPLPKYIPTSL